MRLRSIRDSQAGFTLVEILVGLAILGIITTGLATLLASTNSQMKNYNSKFNSMALAMELKSTLDVPEICKTLLQGQHIGALANNPVRIQMQNGTVLQKDAALRNYGLYLDELYFDAAVASGTSATGNPISTSSLYLRSSGYDGANSPSSPTYKGVRFKTLLVSSLTVEHDASGTIMACKAASGLVENCASMNGVYDPATLKCTLPTPDGSTLCAKLGGSWNGSACNTSTAESGSAVCAKLGGSWNGTSCSLGSSSGGGGGGGGGGGMCTTNPEGGAGSYYVGEQYVIGDPMSSFCTRYSCTGAGTWTSTPCTIGYSGPSMGGDGGGDGGGGGGGGGGD